MLRTYPSPEPTPTEFLAEPTAYNIQQFNQGASQVYEFYYLDGTTRKPLTHGEVEIFDGYYPNGGSLTVDLNGATMTGGSTNYRAPAEYGADDSETTLIWKHNGIETTGIITVHCYNATSQMTWIPIE